MINRELLATIKMLKGGNPQQIAMDLLKQTPINDPTISQLITYAQKGDNDNFLNLATNYFQQNGMNIDSEFNSFIEMLK